MKKKIIIGIILTVIILVGIVITCTLGLNFDLIYTNHKEVDIYIEQEFNNDDIYNIAKEVLGQEKILVQKVELYEDMVSISVKDITDEQLENLNNKINEKYGIENKIEDIDITSSPNVRGRDLIKPYILPVVITFILIIIYIAIYSAICSHNGAKIDIIKTLAKSIGVIIGTQLLYLSLIAITRIPINRLTIPFAIVIYVITTIGILLNIKKEIIEK